MKKMNVITNGEPNGNTCHDAEERNTTDDPRKVSITKYYVIKNFSVLCIALYFVFTPSTSNIMLQSTMNQRQGTGVASLGIIFGSNAATCFILSKYIVSKFGFKTAMLLSMVGYLAFIAANFHHTWLIIIPTAIMNGIAASVLWTALCMYINQLAVNICCLIMKEKHNQLTNRNDNEKYDAFVNSKELDTQTDAKYKERTPFEIIDSSSIKNMEINARSSIILKSFYSDTYYNSFTEGRCNRIENNIYSISKYNNDTSKQKSNMSKLKVSNCVLVQSFSINELLNFQENPEYKKLISWMTGLFFGIFEFFYRSSDIWGNLLSYYTMKDGNMSDDTSSNDSCICGSGFCNTQVSCFEHNLVEPSQQVKNFISSIFLGMVVVAALLLFVFLDTLENEKENVKLSFDLLLSTSKFIRQKNALLLIPITSSIGLIEGFYMADFVKSYVACSWGIRHVGLVTVSFGIFSGISPPLSGWLVKYVNRIVVIISGIVIGIIGCILCLCWRSHPTQTWLLFFIAGILATALGILSSQVKAYYGILFKDDEAAYAACWIWIALGYCLSFTYTNYLCTYIKVYILLIILILGMVGYLKTESISCRSREETKL